MRQLNIGIDKAWQKIKYYCGYQERSHTETRDKLYGFGLYKQEVEGLLSRLIEEDYLNEERFA
ncbi:MAG: RecX family transcriptional regulator, partial [Ferruginibacter sp.]